MDDFRTTPEIDAPTRLRARRREAGLVAEYIHELSDRHGATRQESPTLGEPSPTARGADHHGIRRGLT